MFRESKHQKSEKGILVENTVCLRRKKQKVMLAPWIYEFGLFEEARHGISTAYQFLVTFRNSSCEFLLEPGRHEICLSCPQWTLL